MNFLLLVMLFGCALAMRQQAVAVSGRLMCGNKPAAGVKVKLWDEDDGPDPDDVLDEGYTDPNGEFHLKGSERELTNIDPVFKVYHDCDDGIKMSPIFLIFVLGSCLAMRQQSVAVTGKLRCGNQPAAGVQMSSIFLIFVLGSCLAMRQQSVAVTGKLRCGNQPAAGVQVKLWDEDEGIDPDDLLAEVYTDGNGFFNVKGSERELTTIDPVLKVYHNCDDSIKIGLRKVKFRVPKSYISNGGMPRRVFDIGVLNLETIFAKEERDFL
ncbi:Transthyretin-like family protein [Dictyocaulus viviparus]|uniref:Transthyretin-like family protein n=1 Tax=Dictyocaulus viviparus TaxID=29172 RepID=A0A0D8XSR1_DICVI|nr:Transthyretin-like family protein [Dictyocaulus viviparus]